MITGVGERRKITERTFRANSINQFPRQRVTFLDSRRIPSENRRPLLDSSADTQRGHVAFAKYSSLQPANQKTAISGVRSSQIRAEGREVQDRHARPGFAIAAAAVAATAAAAATATARRSHRKRPDAVPRFIMYTSISGPHVKFAAFAH